MSTVKKTFSKYNYKDVFAIWLYLFPILQRRTLINYATEFLQIASVYVVGS